MDKDMLHKELDLIQGCITRMASNSFYLKGWYISLMVLSLNIFYSQKGDLMVANISALIMTCVFWCLDGFFLKTETLYRWKYEWVIHERIHGNTANFYDLNPYNKNMWLDSCEKGQRQSIWIYIFSKTLWQFYGCGVVVPTILIVWKTGC